MTIYLSIVFLSLQFQFQFISLSIDPLQRVNHMDVEIVIEDINIYKVQQYSWILCKSVGLHIYTKSALQMNNIVRNDDVHYYTFAVSKNI
jgi:hypothetical protein